METRENEDVPVEAGEDGTFDLGSPSPPTSPAKPSQQAVPSTDDSSKAPAAESELCGSPPIKDDWEKVDLNGADDDGPPLAPETTSSQEAGRATPPPPPPEESLEDFKDAFEANNDTVDQAGTGTKGAEGSGGSGVKGGKGEAGPGQAAAAVETSVCQPPPIVDEQPPAVAGKAESVIAMGLANVRLPIGYGRRHGEPEDTDDEEQFHDAFDSGPGMVKDAAKAREMKETGNEHYRNKQFEDAVDYYTMALHYCPEDEEHKKDRAVYLANRAQGHLQLKEYETVVEDCTAALELDPSYVKAFLRRAQANERLEKYDLALQDAKGLLVIDPGLRLAKESVPRLEKLQNDKNELMKEEAIGKLKELGNSILGNFGLSTDNFKMKQDPETGSYSVNFER